MDIELAQALEENAKLKNENEKLKEKINEILTKDFVEDVSVSLEYAGKLSAAKELLKQFIPYRQVIDSVKFKDLAEQAELFLDESCMTPNDSFEVTEKGKEYLSSH